ncbi:hypothetical protein Bbelb_048410 [Branchiostoma belcheri]|nr:hypothetical protein Bbelb_048410 [Branchiostoma belcheri]
MPVTTFVKVGRVHLLDSVFQELGGTEMIRIRVGNMRMIDPPRATHIIECVKLHTSDGMGKVAKTRRLWKVEPEPKLTTNNPTHLAVAALPPRCFALIRAIAKQFEEGNIAGQKKRQVTQALFEPLKGKPIEEQEAWLERLAGGATVKEFKEGLGRVRHNKCDNKGELPRAAVRAMIIRIGSKSAVDKVMKKMSTALTKSFKKDTPKKRQRKPTKKALEAMEESMGGGKPFYADELVVRHPVKANSSKLNQSPLSQRHSPRSLGFQEAGQL